MYLPAAALLPVGALGVVGLCGRGPAWLREHRSLGGLLALGAAAGLARWQLGRWFTEQPAYEVEAVHDGFEIRRYRPRVVAETTVDDGDWNAQLDEGFRRLAGYIFGGNRRNRKLAMTAPVEAAPARPEKIAMTAPVLARSAAQGLTVTFTMPEGYTLATLPEPLDERVRLRVEGGERMAALRFRGTYGRKHTRAMEGELLRRVRGAGLEPIGPASFAGYDAPSTLPFLRRVEILVPVQAP